MWPTFGYPVANKPASFGAVRLTGKDVKASGLTRFLDFLARYWIVLIGLLLATPYLFKWIANLKVNASVAQKEALTKSIVETAENNAKQNAIQDLAVNASKEDSILKNFADVKMRDRLKTAAKNLAFAFGTAADSHWWDVTTLTEDDTQAGKILTDNWAHFKYLEALYQNVYTKNRNLKSDIAKLLDNDIRAKVVKYYRSKKSYVLG